jgi:hypothetical protein
MNFYIEWPDMSPDRRAGVPGQEPAIQTERIQPAPLIEMAAPELVYRYLQEPLYRVPVAWPFQDFYRKNYKAERTDANHPIGQWSTCTTPSSPAVLYDDGAAFCSPTLAFDEAGSAIACHDSPIGFEGFHNLEKLFFPQLPQILTDGKITMIMSGTNVDVTEIGQAKDYLNPIDWAVQGIRERFHRLYPDGDFHALVSKQYDNQYETHQLIPPNTKMLGFLFIPRYLARDRQNHVLAIADNTEEMRKTFSWTALSK